MKLLSEILKQKNIGHKTIKKCDRQKTYLAWIANFGVVPLFLFCAFLFAPAFFFLASLLPFVPINLRKCSDI